MADENQSSDKLISEVQKMREEIQSLAQNEIFRLYDSPARLLGFNVLKGLAFGFGSVVGATILVSILVYVLSSIEFIPIIGEWGKSIIDEIQNK